jgi:hypothetical protein
MDKKIVDKTKKIIFGSTALMVFAVVLLATGAIDKLVGPEELAFVSQSSHTGLMTPMNQIAMSQSEKQYAVNTQQDNVAIQPDTRGDIASGDNPVVLFDISAKSGNEGSYSLTSLGWIWIVSGLVTLFAAMVSTIGYLKRRRIEKAKG